MAVVSHFIFLMAYQSNLKQRKCHFKITKYFFKKNYNKSSILSVFLIFSNCYTKKTAAAVFFVVERF